MKDEWVQCETCHQGFMPKYEWQRKCWPCFLNSKQGQEWKSRKEQYANGFNQNYDWERGREENERHQQYQYQQARQEEYARQQRNNSQQQNRDYHGRFSAPTFDKDFLRKLIMLCHPDKHGGSTMSNEVTKQLLQMKEKS